MCHLASEKKKNSAPVNEPFEYEPAECFDKVKSASRGRPKLILNAVGQRVVEALGAVMATEFYVFGGKEPLPEKKFRVLYKRVQETTGVTATLHQLRKSFTTFAVKSDVPPDVLKTILGHKNISTTMDIYNEVRE